MNAKSFQLGKSNVEFSIHFGTGRQGTRRVSHATLESSLGDIQKNKGKLPSDFQASFGANSLAGNPPFLLQVEFDTAQKQGRGVLFRLQLSCGELLKAFRNSSHQYNLPDSVLNPAFSEVDT